MAIDLAIALDGIIINADSLQWYRGLDILTAKPSAADHHAAPHRLFGTMSIMTKGSVATWQNQAIDHIQHAASQDRWSIVVGGTGLYIKALVDGLSPIPPISDTIRAKTRALCASLSLADFKDFVFAQDPKLADHPYPPADTQRLIRALDVKWQTHHSIRDFQGTATPPLCFERLLSVVIAPDRPTLLNRQYRRLHHMTEEGVFDEIDAFWRQSPPPPDDCILRKALGLMPFTNFMKGTLSLDQAIDLAFIETRQYAKRQMTWLNGQGTRIGAAYMTQKQRDCALTPPSSVYLPCLMNPSVSDILQKVHHKTRP